VGKKRRVEPPIPARDLDALRDRLGIGISELADMADVDRTYLGRLLAGRELAAPRTWTRIIGALRRAQARGARAHRVEHARAVREMPDEYLLTDSPAARIREHIERYIAACAGDQAALYWGLVQLRMHLPIPPPAPDERRPQPAPKSAEKSSTGVD